MKFEHGNIVPTGTPLSIRWPDLVLRWAERLYWRRATRTLVDDALGSMLGRAGLIEEVEITVRTRGAGTLYSAWKRGVTDGPGALWVRR